MSLIPDKAIEDFGRPCGSHNPNIRICPGIVDDFDNMKTPIKINAGARSEDDR